MKKDFKSRISEMAAKIAAGASDEVQDTEKEIDEEKTPDAARVEKLLGQVKSLDPLFKAINTTKEVQEVVEGVIGMFSPDIAEASVRTALNNILTQMSKDKQAAPQGSASDDAEIPMNEAFVRMQKLSGIIK